MSLLDSLLRLAVARVPRVRGKTPLLGIVLFLAVLLSRRPHTPSVAVGHSPPLQVIHLAGVLLILPVPLSFGPVLPKFLPVATEVKAASLGISASTVALPAGFAF